MEKSHYVTSCVAILNGSPPPVTPQAATEGSQATCLISSPLVLNPSPGSDYHLILPQSCLPVRVPSFNFTLFKPRGQCQPQKNPVQTWPAGNNLTTFSILPLLLQLRKYGLSPSQGVLYLHTRQIFGEWMGEQLSTYSRLKKTIMYNNNETHDIIPGRKVWAYLVIIMNPNAYLFTEIRILQVNSF